LVARPSRIVTIPEVAAEITGDWRSHEISRSSWTRLVRRLIVNEERDGTAGASGDGIDGDGVRVPGCHHFFTVSQLKVSAPNGRIGPPKSTATCTPRRARWRVGACPGAAVAEAAAIVPACALLTRSRSSANRLASNGNSMRATLPIF